MSNKLLVAAANHWSSPFQVGSHELTKQFIKDGWQVAFISDPISSLHLANLKSKITKERFRINRNGGEYFFDNKLWAYVPLAIFSPQNFPLLRSKFLYKNWASLTIPNLLKKIKQVGFDTVDLVYFDSLLQSFLMDKIKYKKSIFRIADNYSGFYNYSKNSVLFEKKLAGTADLVIYSAKNLVEYISTYNTNKTYYLPNGVDFEFFFNGSKELPDEFSSIPQPRIIYIGAIDDWFNTDLINLAANSLPDLSFVLIGNSNKIKNKISKSKNIHLLGLKPYSEIPKYLNNSDIGIIPFRVKEMGKLVNSINPLKLYQYFACGLPVVASKWNELVNLNSPAHLYSNNDEFIEIIKFILNSDSDKNVFINFAKMNDWQEKYRLLLKELNY